MFWKKKKEEPESSVSWTKVGEQLFKITVRGKFNEDELHELQKAGAREINKVGSIKGLIVLEEFLGWGDKINDDLDFLVHYDSQIEKIAVVGAAEHEQGALLFLGAGYRQAEVRYFVSNEDAAMAWLS